MFANLAEPDGQSPPPGIGGADVNSTVPPVDRGVGIRAFGFWFCFYFEGNVKIIYLTPSPCTLTRLLVSFDPSDRHGLCSKLAAHVRLERNYIFVLLHSDASPLPPSPRHNFTFRPLPSLASCR